MNKIAVKRYINNPIISPDSNSNWESYAVFNGSPIKDNQKIYLIYRAMGESQYIDNKNLRLSTIGIAASDDGKNFSDRKLLIRPNEDYDKFGCEDPRVTKIDNDFFIFYTALGWYPPSANSIKIAVALTDNLNNIQEKHLVTPFNGKAMTLFPEKINGKYTALLTVNTDNPPAKVALAYFDKKEEIWNFDYWQNWYRYLDDHILPLQRINSDQVEIGSAPVKTPYGWLLFYAYIRDYYSKERVFAIESVLLDFADPQKIVGTVRLPIFIPQEHYELNGVVPNVIFPSGAIFVDDKIYIYYGATDTTCCLAIIDQNDLYKHIRINTLDIPKFTRFDKNPIIEPNSIYKWQNQAVLNPAAVYKNNRIHLIYRAMGEDNTSVMGYASSSDGYIFDEMSSEPIYKPRETFEQKKTANCYSGCEDPRITEIDNRFYMCYTAYNGVDRTRVALTSISIDDFVAKRWNWSAPVLISPPGVDDKDACIFPGKINDKYVIFHRIEDDIVIDYPKSLNFDGSKWLEIHSYITVTDLSWESEKIGMSSPPLSTDRGWLLFYHGVSRIDHQYRVGAMLLNKQNPGHILGKTKYPLLEADVYYEKIGVVPNVVFPCGAVKIGDMIFLYYGAADRVIGVATYSYKKLLNYLEETRYKRYLIE